MTRSLNALFLLCLVPFCYINAQQTEKVDVAVYYEALCIHSIEFITKQLYPALQKPNITKHVNLRLVPYGKTKTLPEVNDTKFECNHGPRECYANKIHACALDKLPKPTQEENRPLEFIKCAMVADAKLNNPSDTTYPVAECEEKEENITQCAKTAEGSLLLQNLGIETALIQNPLAYCPTIVFNGKFDATISKNAENNFIRTLCGYIKQNDQPEDCRPISAGGFRGRPSEITLYVAVFLLLTIFQAA